MGYVLLLLATLAWSFVGILVKTASTMVDSSIITLSRFFFGVLFLILFLLWRDGRIVIRVGMKWIWLGAIGKSLNYLLENLALSIGYAYGNILVMPAQTVTLLLAARFLFGEKVTAKGWTAAVLCLAGVLVIGWNGEPLGALLQGGGLTTLLFTLAGMGAAVHVLSQRQLVKEMDNGNMNLSVFSLSTLIVALPVPLQQPAFHGPVTVWAWGALVLLGLITGLSFFGWPRL
ncbi:DMT family transporter [Paenibacillus sp. CC-CFT747]|nr:DMT family transporter [Paenibacillus sp. CC-CFT747]